MQWVQAYSLFSLRPVEHRASKRGAWVRSEPANFFCSCRPRAGSEGWRRIPRKPGRGSQRPVYPGQGAGQLVDSIFAGRWCSGNPAGKLVENLDCAKSVQKIMVVPSKAGFGKTLFSDGRVGVSDGI